MLPLDPVYDSIQEPRESWIDGLRSVVSNAEVLRSGNAVSNIVTQALAAGLVVALAEIFEPRIDKMSSIQKLLVIMAIALVTGFVCTFLFNVIDNTARYLMSRRRRHRRQRNGHRRSGSKNNDDNV